MGSYAHDHFGAEFEWFIVGGDDLFVIPENLKAYLASDEILSASDHGKKPMFLGRRFSAGGQGGQVFNSGGAGYVLNRAALSLLNDHLRDGVCTPHLHGFFEDVQTAKCLQKHGCEAYD